jgi:hypothetical protein
MMRFGRRARLVLLFVGMTMLSFTVATAAGQLMPKSRHALPPKVSPQPPQPQLVLLGRGAEDASRVLTTVQNGFLPFVPVLPAAAAFPPGYELAQAESHIQSGKFASLDIDYVASGNAQVQLFESNSPNTKPVSAPVEASDSLVIGGASWRYLRLSFPQPSGTPLVVHFADRPFDGQTYVSVSLDSRGDLAAEKGQLIAIIASLH